MNGVSANTLADGASKTPLYRISVKPTKVGYVFIALVVVLLLMAVNYSNNLLYAFCFLLLGFLIVDVCKAYFSLKGLQLKASKAEPVFAGETAQLHAFIEIEASKHLPQFGLQASVKNCPATILKTQSDQNLIFVLQLPCNKRGRCLATELVLVSYYVLGLFEAKRTFISNAVGIAYPAPAGTDWPVDETQPTYQGQEAQDFAGLKPYVAGDSVKRLAWKSIAKGGAPAVKLFDGAEGDAALVLDWAQAEGGDEARLSQLARWVLNADERDLSYSVRLPLRLILAGSGQAHLRNCLTELALYGEVSQ